MSRSAASSAIRTGTLTAAVAGLGCFAAFISVSEADSVAVQQIGPALILYQLEPME